MWGFPAGLIGGRIYFLITTPSQIPPHWWGPFAIWKGGLGHLGRDRRRRGRRAVGPAPSARARRHPAVHGRRRARPARRAGDRPDRQLLQPGAVRQADHAAVGAEDRSRPPPARLRAVRHLPAHVPVRDHLEPVAGRRSSSGSDAAGRSRPPGLFALYVAGYSAFRMFEETLRIDYSNHILGLRLNFFVAVLLCIAGLLWFVAIQRVAPAPQRRAAWRPAPVAGLRIEVGRALPARPGHVGSARRSRSASRSRARRRPELIGAEAGVQARRARQRAQRDHVVVRAWRRVGGHGPRYPRLAEAVAPGTTWPLTPPAGNPSCRR